MATCKDCIHCEACERMISDTSKMFKVLLSEILKMNCDIKYDSTNIFSGAEICQCFQDRSRFVELPPCKEGDSVYSICFCYGEGDTITEWTVVDIFLLSSKEEGNLIGIRLKDGCIFINILPCELGDRYFLTKEAAEQALKERKK